MVDPLAPAGVRFFPVSPALATVRLTVVAIACAIPALACLIIGALLSPWAYLGIIACAVFFAWLLWLIPRQVRALGFAITDTDFLVRRGILFRRLDIVPYGRIQFVDISEGPVARRLGIAEIQLHTAAASTDAKLDGLPADQAAELRDMLAKGGATNLSGL